MVLAVPDCPVPASTGMRPAMRSTAVRSSAAYSASYSAAASPVEPATTTRLRAAGELAVEQATPGVEVEFARRRERRGERSDAAVQIARREIRREVRSRCYLRRETGGKYAGRGPGGFAGTSFRPRKAALTETPTRPAPNENHLLINAYTTHPQSPLLAVTRRISDSGCNLVDARLSTVGRDVSVPALAIGSVGRRRQTRDHARRGSSARKA